MRMKTAQQEARQRVATAQSPPVTVADRSRNGSALLLDLQRTQGNRHVQRLLRSGLIQAKLTVSEPGDRFEQEADRVADQVMRMAEPEVTNRGAACGANISCAGAEGAEKIGRQMAEEEEEEKTVQTKEAAGQAPELSENMHRRVGDLAGRGAPLPESARAFFEPRFDHDFGDVRIHTDSPAAETARGMNAMAFTVGRDIAFAEGQYSPDSMEGRKLLAHELTHVIQQGGSVQRKPANHPANNEDTRVARLKAPLSVQRRLVTFGTLADVNALIGLIGPSAGLTLNLNVANNQMRIAAVLPGVPPSPALRAQLTTIINHATQHAEVIVARGQPLVSVGAFPQPADLTVTRVQQIDIDDILAIEAGAAGNGVAKVAHEIQENFQAHSATPVAGTSRFAAAHASGLTAESNVTEQLVGPGRRDGGVTVAVSPTVSTVIQDFENYYLVFTATTTAATQNTVLSAARRAAPVVISTRTIDSFASGSSAFPAGSAAATAATIAAAAADVAANPTSTVLIEGFADAGGSAAANQTVTRNRGVTARTALVGAGVLQGRTRVEPRGATGFVAPNVTAADRAQNRRVVITVRRPGP